jgi:hypothetical protein
MMTVLPVPCRHCGITHTVVHISGREGSYPVDVTTVELPMPATVSLRHCKSRAQR